MTHFVPLTAISQRNESHNTIYINPARVDFLASCPKNANQTHLFMGDSLVEIAGDVATVVGLLSFGGR